MALAKKGGFGLDLEAQFKDAPRVAEVTPVDTHTHADTDAHADTRTYTDTDTHTDTHTHTDTDAHTQTHADTHTDAPVMAEPEYKTKRTYGLVQQTVFDKVTAYAKANNTSLNAIVCDLLEDFIREKGL